MAVDLESDGGGGDSSIAIPYGYPGALQGPKSSEKKTNKQRSLYSVTDAAKPPALPGGTREADSGSIPPLPPDTGPRIPGLQAPKD